MVSGSALGCGTTTGTTNDVPSTDAVVGTYARDYFGNTSFCFTQSDPAYNNLSNALSGNFSVTAWVKTTDSVSGDFANAYFGSPIFFSGEDYNNHCDLIDRRFPQHHCCGLIEATGSSAGTR